MPTCWMWRSQCRRETTFALEYLHPVVYGMRFVNADLIAAGLSPLAPERELMAASRLFLQEIESCMVQAEDFAFETTLSGRSFLTLVHRLRADGWRVELIYLAHLAEKCPACALQNAWPMVALICRQPALSAGSRAAWPTC